MIFRFAVVSGLGWLIDFSIFALLNSLGFPVWLANIVGATTAVLFVFFASVRKIFQYNGHYILWKLLNYIVYQIIAIICASLLIDFIALQFGMLPIIAKIIVTPLTFYANFQFMSFLTTGRLRLK
ncbi:MAG: GtrA family protein [Citrobacter sp.]|jgi:putative flippase GtrA|uniref:GtrA family protein n=1 Tax=Citrobacter TaxID=544 RepID=UPI00182EA8B9|nr:MULTISPECIES: GtrA family protein [Citrobacter]MBA7795205.1 GtrA family protein [Citrobacter sp. RHBSTW-01065]MBJ8952269.1 GtrA family protein [Citrobacter braakii]MBJ9225410.1 GtrA family protein [Citrobacter braakii]MBR7616789.1 GtrA family protein [Citrobacter braakii]MBU5643604.1 GtrA family protein [Citrobacter sp. S46_ASV_140]